jgi:hypothetical protein
MATEILNVKKTVVVYNPKSGSGNTKAELLRQTFIDYWPYVVGFFSIEQLISNPLLLKDVNIIIFGGDGSCCNIAEIQRSLNSNGWCLMMDGGTLGDTAKFTGVGRRFWETTRHYVKRIAGMQARDELIPKEFSPGVIIHGGEENFLWIAGGTGITHGVLFRIEQARSWKWIKCARLAHGLIGIIDDLKSEKGLEVTIPETGEIIQAADVNVIRHLKRFASMTMPDSGDYQLWIIPTITNKKEIWAAIIRLGLDALRMKAKLNPMTGVVRVTNLKEGQIVNIHGNNIHQIQKDSEIMDIDPTTNITIKTNSDGNTKPYRLLVKKS